MENKKVELTVGGKTLAVVKIQREIFLGDALSSLLFVITIMPLSYILMKYAGGYKFTKLPEYINKLMYKDYIKLFTKTVKELETLKNDKTIQPEYRNGIWH